MLTMLQGSWSIGIFRGPSPLQLQPLDDTKQGRSSSAANPVLTCASVTGPPSNFVADPFLLQRDGKLYLFYETKAAQLGRGQIGVAVSSDGGASFQHLGVALDLPWHLSYPFVFEHGGQVYMLPEGSGSGRLTLYRAAQFPLVWEEERVLVPRPLVDASLVEWQSRWYLLASDLAQPGAAKNGNLNVWHATSPLGPWEPHPANPVANGPREAGFRNGGRLVVHDGRLYRFGQDCGETYGHKLVAYEVTQLSPTQFEQRMVPHSISGLGGQRKRSWISVRHHHIDAQQLPSGEWIAAIDGDSVPSGPISSQAISIALHVLLPWACVACTWAALRAGVAYSPGLRRWAASGGMFATRH
ncbi:hypothetical protein COHA_002275 [Chlorella ohadii]|uniref:Glucosamine inositolphosphorylceramide transferase 1 N-terminal domain-containing protein n=1 Tax=Chlorella ohadii TaxID=2649997 RepID=A0AAD5DXS2_9CHLO|nr:hypothetical protein COHA_002275 [Chlorella ohadii]